MNTRATIEALAAALALRHRPVASGLCALGSVLQRRLATAAPQNGAPRPLQAPQALRDRGADPRASIMRVRQLLTAGDFRAAAALWRSLEKTPAVAKNPATLSLALEVCIAERLVGGAAISMATAAAEDLVAAWSESTGVTARVLETLVASVRRYRRPAKRDAEANAQALWAAVNRLAAAHGLPMDAPLLTQCAVVTSGTATLAVVVDAAVRDPAVDDGFFRYVFLTAAAGLPLGQVVALAEKTRAAGAGRLGLALCGVARAAAARIEAGLDGPRLAAFAAEWRSLGGGRHLESDLLLNVWSELAYAALKSRRRAGLAPGTTTALSGALEDIAGAYRDAGRLGLLDTRARNRFLQVRLARVPLDNGSNVDRVFEAASAAWAALEPVEGDIPPPSAYTLNIVLQSLVRHGGRDAAAAVLDGERPFLRIGGSTSVFASWDSSGVADPHVVHVQPSEHALAILSRARSAELVSSSGDHPVCASAAGHSVR